MQMVMEVQRHAGQYQGSVTRASDQHRVAFIGVLELIAAIERLESGANDDASPAEQRDPLSST
ncbi:MAG: hypothetical protein JWP39_1345 [Jatrophihabitans sp.]|nr:hypothetical protein [Jatrophihabitans sp.]